MWLRLLLPQPLESFPAAFVCLLLLSYCWNISPLHCIPSAGTGKTVTLVEHALQLLKAYPHARLLLYAPQASQALLTALLPFPMGGRQQ